MRSRSLLIGTAVFALALQARADTVDEVERLVRTIKTVFDSGDVEMLKRLMTEDHMATLSYVRFSNRADQLKVLGEFKISAYEIEGLKVKALTDGAALASFRASIKGTYKGKEVPSPVQVMEVWIKRDGKWQQASYQETPIGEK